MHQSPTPWAVVSEPDSHYVGIMDANGVLIGLLPRDLPQAAANAVAIVRAINEHEGLVAACLSEQ